MRAARPVRFAAPLLMLTVCGSATAEDRDVPAPYTLAFASFAPLNTDLFIADADGSHAQPLLAHPDLDYNASFSSDGQWIVFTSRREGSSDIFRAHPDGSGLERLVDDPAFDDQAALSPDGKQLAFVSSRSGNADIWILDLTTRALRNLTNHPAGEFRPAWPPDGRRIAFTSDRDSQRPPSPSGFATLHSVEIYVMDADGANQRRITHDQAFAGSPVWSADGTKLAFYTVSIADLRNILSPRRLRGTGQIVTLNLQTNERTTLTSGKGEKWSPRWLSDKQLAYVSGGPEGGLEFTAGSPGPRGELGSPSWSADGKRMVFHRDVENRWPPHRPWHTLDRRFHLTRTGVFPSYSPSGERMIANDQTAGILHNSILIMRADGSQSSVLFRRPDKSALAPTWARRGDHIAFSLGKFFQNITGTSTADIAVIRDDGSGLRVMTDGKANYGFPSWASDGMRLVYREATAQKNALHILDTRTNTKRVLIQGPAHYNFPGWSPVADVIAFTSDMDGDYEIYSIHADGTRLQRLTRTAGNDAHSAWSSDGQWIAFASSRGGFKNEAALHPLNPQPYGEIYVMRADGSEARALTDDQFEEATPAWMPQRRSRQGVLAALPPEDSPQR